VETEFDFVRPLAEECDEECDADDFVLFVADLEVDAFELVFAVELFATGLVVLAEGAEVEEAAEL
jgi:hypothetical protein